MASVSPQRTLHATTRRSDTKVSDVRTRLALTVREAAATIGVGRDAVYNAINRGELRAVKFGGTLLVPRVELERLLGLECPELVAVADVLRELFTLLEGRSKDPPNRAEADDGGASRSATALISHQPVPF